MNSAETITEVYGTDYITVTLWRLWRVPMTAHKYVPLYGIGIIWPLLKNTEAKFCINHFINIIIFFCSYFLLLLFFLKPMKNFFLFFFFIIFLIKILINFAIYSILIILIPFWGCSIAVCISKVCVSHCSIPDWHISVCMWDSLFPKRRVILFNTSQSLPLSVFNFVLAQWLKIRSRTNASILKLQPGCCWQCSIE